MITKMMKLFVLIVSLTIPSIYVLFPMIFNTQLFQTAYHHGPVTEYFDGRRFSHPTDPGDKSVWEVLKWKLTSDRDDWPDWVDITPSIPADRADDLTITFINQASFLIQLSDVNILTDPIFSMRCSPVSWAGPKRVHAPGIRFDDLPSIDIILISHIHYDHLDIPSLKRLVRRDDPLIIAGLGTDTIIHRHIPNARIKLMNWGDDWQADDMDIHYRPLVHWGQRSWYDRNYALWGAFVINDGDHAIYFAGDTGYGDGSVFGGIKDEFGAMDLALLPIGAYEPRWFMGQAHVDPTQAVQIQDDLSAEIAIAHHWGTFQLTDEARMDPVDELKQARGDRDFRILHPGGHFVITK